MGDDRRHGRPLIVVISRSCKCVKSQSVSITCHFFTQSFCRRRARDTQVQERDVRFLVTDHACSFAFCLDMQKESKKFILKFFL